MKRGVLIGIIAVLSSLAITTLIYQSRNTDADALSDDAATARHMWETLDTPPAPERELEDLRNSLKRNPEHVPILLRMAQVSRELGNREEALENLRKALQVDSKNREARLELGRVLFEAGDVDGAIRETEQLLKLDPSSTDGLYNLGAIYGNIGQKDRAREYWTKAVAIAPDSESGQRARNALDQLGR
ncbi:MAG TPA: tetratricopeptide repeat protein [Terriglobia bacterium]|nr:tetratricopeptide repeat protein [Terriglobia bacterium]